MAKKLKPENNETTTEAVAAEQVREEKGEVVYPEVAQTGAFQAVKVGNGYAVYNPMAIRVTGVLSLNAAEDIVRAQNRAAQIKVRG